MTREEAIEALTSKDVCNSDVMLEALDMAIEALKQESKTGHWVNNQNGTFTCDICGCKHSKSNYCPNCGADMRGGE